MAKIERWAARRWAAAGRRLARDYRRALAGLAGGDWLAAGSGRGFEALLEAAPAAIVVLDGQARIRLVNQQAECLFGWSRTELVGNSAGRLIPARLRASHQNRFAAYMREPRARPMERGLELLVCRRDGSELPVEVGLATISTPDGPLICAVIRDMSERRRIQSARREAEELFRAAFDAAPVGMVLAELDGTISKVNSSLCRMLGRSASELEGWGIKAILAAEDADREAMALARLACGEAVGHRAERRYLHRDGHQVPVEVNAAVAHNDEGNASHLLLQVSDITERKRFESELLYLADHDPLTGVFNRRRFEQELTRELARLARGGGEGALLVIDLDRFKAVNDTLGHAAGDELIAAVACSLRERLRQTDTLARLGGDEFAAILPGCGREQALAVAASLLEAVHSANVACERCEGPGVGGGGLVDTQVSASIGIALLDEGSSNRGEEKLAEADVAMYEAKSAGRDRVVVYELRRGRRAARRQPAMAQRIRHALDSGGLMLYAQPIVALGLDPLARRELLLRMSDAHGELLDPESFLHVAERSGLIGRIDRWVLEQAVGLLAQPRDGERPIHVAVNISAASILDPALPRDLAELLSRQGIDGAGLCIEISEAAAIVNIAHAPGFAREIAALGCELALDDFGAGFASLHYLEHLQFDYLKIDGEFVRRLADSPVKQSVVRAVVEVATSLGKRTIAESVEDAASLEMLRALGVDFAQGFHLAVPAPLALAEPLVDAAAN